MVKVIFFDIDGTLIRTLGVGVRAFAKAFYTLFKFPDVTGRISFAGRTDTSLVREYFWLNNYVPTERDVENFFACYALWLDHLLAESRGGVCPGVREFIQKARGLRPQPVIGLLTGNIRVGAEIKLRHFGLWGEFEVGAFADDSDERDEIARVAFGRAIGMLGEGLSGGEVVVVGDTAHDIRCARAIGARVLAVATGGAGVEELARHNPDWLVNNLTEIEPKDLCL
ncbi:MAG: HAD family hydrolase [Verrucomicrobiia bacterium]|jgi:phosphoglycolate phosphatase-like HAD superfamily hydrolase